MARSVSHAGWSTHINRINAPKQMRRWLTDRMSLTAKLVAMCEEFRVQRLKQEAALCLLDEAGLVGLARPMVVQEREVLLRCNGRPVVFAHTILPLTANASDWPFFSNLGNRSLGTTLFGDPRVVRGELQFARLHARHALARRAASAAVLDIGSKVGGDFPLYARRCLYRRKKGSLLVTEVFLPELITMQKHSLLPAGSAERPPE